jgi:hypothetical protein
LEDQWEEGWQKKRVLGVKRIKYVTCVYADSIMKPTKHNFERSRKG